MRLPVIFCVPRGRIVSVKYYAAPLAFIDGMTRIQHAFMEISNPITETFRELSELGYFRHVHAARVERYASMVATYYVLS